MEKSSTLPQRPFKDISPPYWEVSPPYKAVSPPAYETDKSASLPTPPMQKFSFGSRHSNSLKVQSYGPATMMKRAKSENNMVRMKEKLKRAKSDNNMERMKEKMSVFFNARIPSFLQRRASSHFNLCGNEKQIYRDDEVNGKAERSDSSSSFRHNDVARTTSLPRKYRHRPRSSSDMPRMQSSAPNITTLPEETKLFGSVEFLDKLNTFRRSFRKSQRRHRHNSEMSDVDTAPKSTLRKSFSNPHLLKKRSDNEVTRTADITDDRRRFSFSDLRRQLSVKRDRQRSECEGTGGGKNEKHPGMTSFVNKGFVIQEIMKNKGMCDLNNFEDFEHFCNSSSTRNLFRFIKCDTHGLLTRL